MKMMGQPTMTRRAFTGSALATLASGSAEGLSAPNVSNRAVVFSSKHRPKRETKELLIGCLVFPRQDQIDFTGPFEVFSRVSNAKVVSISKSREPIADVKGLVLTPDMSLEEAGKMKFDVLLVSGGFGQQELMADEDYLSLIRRQFKSNRVVFSVCTGALLCGAAGILQGRLATTHWAAWDLLHFYGATPIQSRVVVDGNYISCAGVTAGIDGALLVASLLRGTAAAEEIQLEIEYAPNPIFGSGSPTGASAEVIRAFFSRYGGVKQAREQQARQFAHRSAMQRGPS